MSNVTIEYNDIYDIWLPVWWQQKTTWLLFLLIVVVVIAIVWTSLYLLRKKRKQPSALESIVKELARIDIGSLKTQEEQKNFYIVLIATIKECLVGCYKLDVMSKTDRELIEYLATSTCSPDSIKQITEIVDHAYMIKFARNAAISEQMYDDRTCVVLFANQSIEQSRAPNIS